jgi:hypothetical protein
MKEMDWCRVFPSWLGFNPLPNVKGKLQKETISNYRVTEQVLENW